MKKEKVIEIAEELPQEFELEELIERLIFIEKVEKGLIQLDEKKTLPHQEVKKKIEEWQK